MIQRLILLPLVLGFSCYAAESAVAHYAGAEVCARCHKEIAATQSTTAMANTWHGSSAPSLPKTFAERKVEGSASSLQYEVRRTASGFELSVIQPGGTKVVLPVEAMVGGKRHGISFLARIRQVDRIPLERPALLEGRYAYSPHGSLVLSPGFLPDKPADYEDGLGRVLAPGFEQRCLTCHGQPGTLGAGMHGGVRCESCHGPAGAHVASLTGGGHQQPSMPEALSGARVMEVCAQCHTGLSSVNHSDPVPADLLVSSQVPALSNSECFIQSGGGIGCTDCHNPHLDSPAVKETSVNACLRCHSPAGTKHAAICPVNATADCVRCHMPSVESNSFRLTDHWIRVHPEDGIRAAKRDDRLRSQVGPKREYLRIIVVEDRARAEAALQRLAKGDSFEDVAHDVSIDPNAPGGGFIGSVALADLDPKLAAAAAQLAYGETSGIVDRGDRFVILNRLSRDFKWNADLLFQQAVALKEHGHAKEAIEKDQAALKVYPYFLRALIFMGSSLGEAGAAGRASEILSFAAQSYPQDASAQFDMALTLREPASQIEALRKAIELDPEMVAAYQSLGAALCSTGQMRSGIEAFRAGLTIDPLSAILYYDVGVALRQQGDEPAAKRALALAARLDPEIAARVAK